MLNLLKIKPSLKAKMLSTHYHLIDLKNPNKITKLDEKILNKIINPTFKGLKEMGIKFKGFLYAGLMIVKNEPYLIEYNISMVDPECHVLMLRL
mgnify:CR=1 FL=1